MSEPTKQRPGDQPLPAKNDLPFIQDAVIADIEARKTVGIERYGTPLQAFNGRSALQDAYEEALDLAVYLKQCLAEKFTDAELGILSGLVKIAARSGFDGADELLDKIDKLQGA